MASGQGRSQKREQMKIQTWVQRSCGPGCGCKGAWIPDLGFLLMS